MKKLVLFFLLVITSGVLQAQENPVKLVSKVKHISGDKYELIISAEIEPEWALYSQNLPKNGPYPTKISFSKKGYDLIGKPVEVSNFKKVVNDPTFNVKLTKYYTNVLFKQVVRIKDKKIKTIQADFDYMTCNSISCLPPTQKTIDFSL